MRDTASGPRVLLKRLRELMQEPLEPQERLDRIVRDIASNMVAEVCSLYVLRADSVLELYATEGLNPNAVHLAQLRLGQGLVGTIAASARPLNLSNAQEHPAFAYLPETGEEIYNSFLGVPVLRAGRTLGVLVVQNKTMRHYRDDEVEALETTAMVIAEMIATGDLARLTRPGLELDLRRPVSFTGLSFNDGGGLGHVVLHEPRIVVTNLFNEDSEEEVRRLEASLGSLRLSIDDMLERRDVAFEGEHRQVLEAYRMFANDRGWVRRLEEAIRNGLTAEAAVEKVQRHVDDAKAKGARVLAGGTKLHGQFFQPTVVADATADMLCATEETFGPLAPIFKFKHEDDAIAAANSTEFGLASYFYSRDIGRITRVSEALECGILGVNAGVIATEHVPFGGVKQSGLGREGSRHGMEEYLEMKYICIGDVLR